MDGPSALPHRIKCITRLLLLVFAVMLPNLPASPALALRASTVYWKNPQERLLLYWINPAGPCSAEQIAMLRVNLNQAEKDWEDICTECGIEFIEVRSEKDAIFRVVCMNVGGVLAQSFYPGDPKAKWILRIDKSYFSTKSMYDKIGILRHEIGHILGYRHEQIMLPDDQIKKCGWGFEKNTDDKSVVALTEYDPQSVMHYICGRATSPVFLNFRRRTLKGIASCMGSRSRRLVRSRQRCPHRRHWTVRKAVLVRLSPRNRQWECVLEHDHGRLWSVTMR